MKCVYTLHVKCNTGGFNPTFSLQFLFHHSLLKHICPIHHPANSFTNVTYPFATHADWKSMNLIYQLQCTECNAFYIGETRHSLSDRMYGHRFITTLLNPDLLVAIHTQSHQIPFQECWSVSVIHRNYQTSPQTTSAANLKLHTPGLYIH